MMQPRARRLATLAVLLLTTLLAGCASTPPSQADDVCEVFREKSRWYWQARTASRRWGTPIPVLMAFTHQESSFRSKARPPRQRLLGVVPWTRPTSAYGYAQATREAWLDYERATGHGGDRDDFDDAMDFVGWYNNTSVRRLGIAPDDAYRLYLAYHEGHTGYARGTYKRKPQLERVARRVADRAARYRSQLARCEDELDDPWWWPF